MNIEERNRRRLFNLMQNEEKFEFPEFLEELRKCYRISREIANNDLNYPINRLYCLENGCFKRVIPMDEITLLADYYNIDSKILKKKADDFVLSGKGVALSGYRRKKKYKDVSL